MHGIWNQEGMKEVREQEICDQRKTYRGEALLEELEMETIKQKIKGESTKDTEMAPALQMVTEEVELFGTKSNDFTEIGVKLGRRMQRRRQLESERPDVMSVAEGSTTKLRGI